MSVTYPPRTTHQWLKPLYDWLQNSVVPALNGTVGGGMQTVQATLNFADFSGIASGSTTFIKAIGAVIPSGARYQGNSIGEGAFTGFWDATNGGFGLELGVSAAPNSIGTSLSVATGASMPAACAPGVGGFQDAPIGNKQLVARLTTSKGMQLDTAGNVVIKIFYTID